MWVKANSGNVVNLAHTAVIVHVNDSGTWYAETYDVDGDNISRLNGSWATAADAQEAIQQLVNAIDPASY